MIETNQYKKGNLFPNKKEYKYTLVALIIIIGIIIFPKIRPYLSGFLAAGTLYILFRKQMYKFNEKKGIGKKLSATIIVLEVIFLILIPLTGIGLLVGDTLSSIKINPQEIVRKFLNFIDAIESKIGVDFFTINNLSFIPKVGSNFIQGFISSISSLVINSIIAVFILYFMLIGYKSIETSIKEVIPLNPNNIGILTREASAIIKANAIGIPLLALIQGIFAYIGYVIGGVNNALLYAVLTGFSSLIPILGTMVVWVPIAINLLLIGNIKACIFITIYGLVIIGSVDNIARLILQKKLADIHPLITVFGVLIGIPIFGFLGVIFGPLLLSLFILFINMYRYEYVPNSIAEPRVTMKRQIKDKKINNFFKKSKKSNNLNKDIIN